MLALPKPLTIELYSRKLEQKACREIELDDCAQIPEVVAAMAALCREQDGLALAAPQVGLYVRLAIVMLHPGNVDLLINPRIDNLSGRDLLEEEGCLSIPPSHTATARIWRSEFVRITAGTLENPNAKTISEYKGLEARVVQHEIDHLEGIFFINRCGPVARQIVLQRYKKYLSKRKGNPWPTSTRQLKSF